jgi:hypothetical protein
MKPSLHLDLGAVTADELPPLAALFLIHFDTKKGYTIEWHRSAPEGMHPVFFRFCVLF